MEIFDFLGKTELRPKKGGELMLKDQSSGKINMLLETDFGYG